MPRDEPWEPGEKVFRNDGERLDRSAPFHGAGYVSTLVRKVREAKGGRLGMLRKKVERLSRER